MERMEITSNTDETLHRLKVFPEESFNKSAGHVSLDFDSDNFLYTLGRQLNSISLGITFTVTVAFGFDALWRFDLKDLKMTDYSDAIILTSNKSMTMSIQNSI